MVNRSSIFSRFTSFILSTKSENLSMWLLISPPAFIFSKISDFNSAALRAGPVDWCDMEGLTKQKNSRPEKFSAREDKLKLISAVKTKPIIWDLTHKGHFNAIGLNNAWEAVAAELQKDVKDCKASWKSLRASMRYHQKISKEKKESGSAGGNVVPGPRANDDYDWDFASEMTFLPDLSDKRRTMTLPKSLETSMSSETCEKHSLLSTSTTVYQASHSTRARWRTKSYSCRRD
ncbi:uncharacterized protein [Drosophila bipectinata]|uniref:uncharacterized protein n=1 Tax=Drosophila bipectinata TaxID=42026 RepID=UPI0038B398E2